jgi:hypothetical protein
MAIDIQDMTTIQLVRGEFLLHRIIIRHISVHRVGVPLFEKRIHWKNVDHHLFIGLLVNDQLLMFLRDLDTSPIDE